jgi:uncharacterized protein with HEPN domain
LLEDMIEACRRIGQYTEGSWAARNWDVRGLDDEIAWRRITGLRDVLAHGYFGIDDDIVWSVVAEEAPTYRSVCARGTVPNARA